MVPPKIKQNEFQDILDNLFPPKIFTSPPKGTSPEEQLTEYLIEYLNGPQAESHAAYKTGATLKEDGHAYFVYQKFFNTLKNKEWKMNKAKTAEEMIRLFEAEFGMNKRYPKKESQKDANPPVKVTKICLKNIDEFLEKEKAPIEEKDFGNKEEIM